MKQKLITILVAFGIAKASAEKYLEKVDAPDEADIDVDKLLTDFKSSQAELLKNDKEFLVPLQEHEAKRWNEIWTTKLKQATGLTAEEVKDKNQKEIVALAVDKLRKKGDSSTEQLQQVNIELENKLKEYEDKIIPEIKAEVENSKRSIKKETAFEKLFDGFELGVSKKVAMAAVRAHFGNQFIDDINDKDELEIYLAGEGKLKPKSKDGTKLLGAKEFVEGILSEEKLLKVSGGGQAATTTTKNPIVVTGKEDKKFSSTVQSNLDKATANITEMADSIKAND